MHTLAAHQNLVLEEFFIEVIFLAVRATKPRPSSRSESQNMTVTSLRITISTAAIGDSLCPDAARWQGECTTSTALASPPRPLLIRETGGETPHGSAGHEHTARRLQNPIGFARPVQKSAAGDSHSNPITPARETVARTQGAPRGGLLAPHLNLT